MVSFLVLDYNRPRELALCIASIKLKVHFQHRIVVLSNGGDQRAAVDLYSEGLIHHLILNKVNSGGGFGTTDLFKFAAGDLAVYVQDDQVLVNSFGISELGPMVAYMRNNPKCKVIGLAGDQCQGRYSERAQLVDTDWYNQTMAKAPNGGPGPYHQLQHNENYLQNKAEAGEFEFKIWDEPLFGDNGKQSFREYPCGGQTLHYTDTKELFVIVPPKERYVFPNLTDEEWKTVIAGKWVNGTIPEKEKAHSFKVW